MITFDGGTKFAKGGQNPGGTKSARTPALGKYWHFR